MAGTGRGAELVAKAAEAHKEAMANEIEEMSFKPDDIPADVWNLIQENGRLATERLNEILSSPRFARLRPGDQAKLITLGQNRAYGQARTNNAAANNKRRVSASDVTATELRDLANRSTLPEYRRIASPNEVVDAEYIPEE